MGSRAILRLVAAALWLALCLPCWALARPFRRERFWVRRFLGGIGRIMGLHVRVEGTPLADHALYVANHISWLDILALGGATAGRFIAKAEIADWGVVGWLAKLGGAVFVSRDRRSATRNQADAVTEALKGRRPVVLFAEGGTGDGLTLEPFRAPLFVSAGEAGVPVQPVAIDYGPGRARFAWPDGASLASEAKRLLDRREPVPVTLRFLPPLDATRLDRKELAIRSHAAIAAALS